MSWNYGRYLELCSVLTSRSLEPNYEEIVEELMVMLKIKAISETNKLSHERHINQQERKDIIDNIKLIFKNKLSYSRDRENINYIGFINIILLQCAIAYTKRYIENTETFLDDVEDFDIYNDFLNLECLDDADVGAKLWTDTLCLEKYIKKEQFFHLKIGRAHV